MNLEAALEERSRSRPDGARPSIVGTRCFVCGSDRVKPYATDHDYHILSCEACHLLWVADDVSEEEVARFYREGYYAGETTTFGYFGASYRDLEPLHRSNARRILSFAADRSKVSLRGARVLDVGCGYGFLLDEARRSGASSCVGVEISAHAAACAKDLLGLDVYPGDVSAVDLPAQHFDFAFMIGTIEHFIRPDLVLQTVSRVLKPGGYIVITTTDTRGPLPFYSLKPPEHLFYFDKVSMSRLLSKHAIELDHYGVLFWKHDLIDVAVRLAAFVKLHGLARWMRTFQKKIGRAPCLIPTNEMLVGARTTPSQGLTA